MKTRRSVRAAAILLLVCACTASLAQTGGLEIRVFEAADETPLPGATVRLTSTQRLVPESAEVTDVDGRAIFPVLRAGDGYVVEISMPGYATHRLPQLSVSSNQRRRISVALSPEMAERVVVSGRSDVVDLEKTGGSTRFSDEFIQDLPVPGRIYQNLLKLAPGVNDADEDGNPNVHGARDRDFKALVDGVSNVDPLTGQFLSYVNPESIEEIEIVQYGAGVEFGRAQGGFARILQKQGSNDFEGVFNFLFRSSKLDGNGASELEGNQVPDFEWVQPALQVSGPIVKDRVWYRLSHEHIDREEPVNILSTIAVTTRTQTISADQITWQVSPRNRLSFQFQSDPLRVENLDLSSAVLPEASQTLDRGGPTYSLNWVAPYSGRLIVDSRVSYQDQTVDVLPSQPGAVQDCANFTTFLSLNGASCLDLDKNQLSGPSPDSSRDRRQRFTVQSNLTFYTPRFLGMSHRVKVGFIAEHERYFQRLESAPRMEYFVVENFFPPPQFFGVATVTVPFPRASQGRAAGASLGVFVEDQFRPTDGLAITLGLRLDREEIRSVGNEPFDPRAEAAEFFTEYENDFLCQSAFENICVANLAQNIFTAYEDIGEYQQLLGQTLDVGLEHIPLGSTAAQSAFWNKSRRVGDIDMANMNFTPRLAVAWDPWKDGKTKISASAGRYFDKIFLGIPVLEVRPETTVLDFIALPDPADPDPPFVATRLSGTLNATVTSTVVDRELRTPFQDELAFGIERELWAESSIKASYLRRKFRDQLQDVDINHDGDIVLNPGWGEILQVGNFDSADYTAYQLEFVRRQFRGWQMNGSYVWSKVVGGAEDFNQLLGNNGTFREDERSFLSYDQRHVVRINAIGSGRGGLRFGTALRWESGLPYSIVFSGNFDFDNPPEYLNLGDPGSQRIFFYPSGTRNDQRNRSFWTVDLKAIKELALSGNSTMQLSAEVFNVLNDDALRQLDTLDGSFAGSRRFGRRFQLGLRVGF